MGRTEEGFTLIEVMVACCVIAILAGTSYPALDAAIEAQRARAAVHGLVTDLAVARTLAITRQEKVAVCPRGAHGECSGGSDWSRGWRVLPATAVDGAGGPGEGQDFRDQSQGLRGNLSLATTAGRSAIVFAPNGRSAGTNLTLRLCRGEALHAQVIVNMGGRIRATRERPGLACRA